MEDTPSDAELIVKSRTESELFGIIFERHHRAVFRYVALRIGIDDAGDTTSDVFTVAFKARHRFEPDAGTAVHWLYGIAYNVLGDRHRRTRRAEKTQIGFKYAAVPSEDESDTTVERLVAESVAPRLNAILARLAYDDQQTFLLFAIEGLTYSEVGAVLGIPVGTVGSRINRCRRAVLTEIPELAEIVGRFPIGRNGV